MKRAWTENELEEHWRLDAAEQDLIRSLRTGKNRLGFALQLKFFQHEGRFPIGKRGLPAIVVRYVARQLGVDAGMVANYAWDGRTRVRHRALIRQHLGFRETSVQEAKELITWLVAEILPHQRNEPVLQEAVYERCRELCLEPPSPKRIERLTRSAIRTFDEWFFEIILARLPKSVHQKLDDLLDTGLFRDPDQGEDPGQGRSILHELKRAPGAATVNTVLSELEKLRHLEAIGLPEKLFGDTSPRVLESYRQRVAVEDLHEMKRHPVCVRYTLLAAFCWQRRQEIIDTLVTLLIDLTHRIRTRAEGKVDRVVFKELRRMGGKSKLLYRVAEASVANPDGIVRDVIFPVVAESTLQDLITEFKLTGSYDRQVRTAMRGSYSKHYRRMVPAILQALQFRSNNIRYQPLIEALQLLQAYVGSKKHEYPSDEDGPLEGIVPTDWRNLVVQQTSKGETRVNRISYELCVLGKLREQLRCKEIRVQNADHYRNPDEDLPQDFQEKRESYYAELDQPLDPDAFIGVQEQALTDALTMLNDGLPTNPRISLGERHGKPWITLSPLTRLPKPTNLVQLKNEVRRHWGWISLLDMLKETDLRVGFSQFFKSATVHENLPRHVLRKRLLLCLYALGTNAGLNRVSAGDEQENYRDLLYVQHRFISKDSLRTAIRHVANAILRVRHPEIWGSDTTACASDAKKFGAWDQNLLTEWHIRYRGPGIMVYWHVEKKSLCIYSQVKRCSSSEVAAMIEGVMRHCTDMEVTKNYVDSHGQSEVAFAFCHLLGFQLMPRLRDIGRQKLYRPHRGDENSFSNLKPILSRSINWALIAQQYDEIIKFAAALKRGTADAEAILRRFTGHGPKHPIYLALKELGKVQKTIFLCDYLNQETARREVQAGLNVIENWNSATGFIHFGQGGELTTNDPEIQELTVLSLHLLQISLVYINTLMLQQVIHDQAWGSRLQTDDLRALTPLFYGHINPYGDFKLDFQKRIAITQTWRQDHVVPYGLS
jgi:TnpA family transposase